MRIFAGQMISLSEILGEIEAEIHQKCREIPYAENILEIRGVGENILAGILAEMGDITRFDDVKEIQKLSGLGRCPAVAESIRGRRRSATGGGKD